MEKVLKEIFVTKDGSEFISKNEAARHERREQALSDIESLLFKMSEMRGARECWGSDMVDEILLVVSDWMVTRRASAKLVKILRHLEEGAPAADPGPKEQGVQTQVPGSGGD